MKRRILAIALSCFATFVLPVSSAFAVDAALADRDRVDRATWVGNAIYHQKPEDVVIGAALAQIYENNPRQEPAQALRAANTLREELRKQVEPHNDSIEAVADTLATIASHIPEAAPYADAIRQYGKWSSVLYDKTIGPENQLISQIQNYDRYARLQNSAEVWEQVWSVSHLSPEAGLAINAFLSPELNADTHQSSAQILSNNPKFAENVAILKAVGPNGQLSVLRADLDAGLNRINERLGELDRRNLDSQESLRDLTIEVRQAKIARAAAQEAEARRAQDQLELQAQRSAVYVFSTLAGAIDPKLGKSISVIGNAAIQISDTLSKFSSLSATTAGSAILTGNILGALMSLSSLFGDSGPTDAQILSQQLDTIGKQIAELAKRMDERFDHVDQELAAIVKELDHGFSHMSSRLERIQQDATAIEQKLIRQQAQLNQLGQDVFAHFSKSLRGQFLREIGPCLASNRYSSSSSMRYSTYRGCLEKFAGYSTNTAGQVLQELSILRDVREATYSGIGSQLGKASTDANVQLLAEIAEKLFNHPLIANFDRSANSTAPLVNPVEWAIGAQAYLDMAAAHPEFARLTEIGGVDQILEIGSRMDRAFKSLTSVATVDGPKANVAFFHGILESYRKSSDALITQLRDAQNRFVKDPANRIAEGIDLWSDEKQLRAAAVSTIKPCSSPDRMYDVELSAPADIAEEMVTPQLATASRMGVANLEFCYEARWAQTPKLLPNKNPSRIEISVVVKVDGRMIARRSASSATALLELPEMTKSARKYRINFGADIPLVDGPIERDWENHSALKNQIASAKTERLDPHDEVARRATQKATKYLEEKRRAFNLHTQMALSGSLYQAAAEMTGLKVILREFVELGLSQSWKRNDYLRMLFQGKERVFDQLEIAAWIDAKVSAANPEELKAEIARRADALEKELIREIEENPAGQTYSALGPTLRRLRDMKEDRLTIIPKTPIAEAVAGIEAKLAELAH